VPIRQVGLVFARVEVRNRGMHEARKAPRRGERTKNKKPSSELDGFDLD
jgi:hypothetical protein